MKEKLTESIDEYIAGFPRDVQKQLVHIRSIIKKAVPKAVETIKYGMPTFVLHGNVVHFAALKKHVALYPVPREKEGFKQALSHYKGSKSSAQFPLDQPLPSALITSVVKDRGRTLAAKASQKKINA